MEFITKRPDWNNKKILLMRLDKLGDLIVTTPFMKAIRDTYPNAQIDLLGSNMNRAFFSYCNYIDTIYRYDKRQPLSIIKLFFTLRAQEYDVIVNFVANSATSNIFMQYLGASTRLCVPIALSENQKYYTHSSPHPKTSHLMEMFQEMAEKMGFESISLRPILPILPETYTKIEAQYPKKANTMRIIISLGNLKRPHNRWSSENYAKVVELLHKKYNYDEQLLDVLIMIGKADMPLLEELKSLPKEYYTLYIGTDIAESAALIDKSDLFICTSSGPSHIASSTSCPILSIMTPNMYKFWRPIREHNTYLVNENLQEIRVEEVLEKIDNYIDTFQEKQSA